MTHFAKSIARLSRELAEATGAPDGRPMAKSLHSGGHVQERSVISGEEFMAKAMAAYSHGALSNAELSECEIAINAGRPPRQELIKAVINRTPPALRGEHDAAFAAMRRNLNLDAPMAKASPAVAPAQAEVAEGMTGEQLLEKAMKLQSEGKLTGSHVAEVEAHVNAGRQPPPRLVRAIVAGEEPELW